MKILPIFERKSFWQFIDETQSRVKSVEFTFVTPNMSNISCTLNDDLKRTAQLSKTAETRIKLSSEGDCVLDINENNKGSLGLVDYASEGGGRIIVKGINVKYDSKKNQKIVIIDSIDAHNVDIAKIIRDIFHGKSD